MKKARLLILITMFMNIFGQITFDKTYGGTKNDEGYCVQHTTDNGYIIVGYTYSYGAGDMDVYLIKTNENGDISWTRTFGSLEGIERSYSIKQTTDSGYIIIGQIVDYTGNDVWLIKTDLNGETVWEKRYNDIGLGRVNNFV